MQTHGEWARVKMMYKRKENKQPDLPFTSLLSDSSSAAFCRARRLPLSSFILSSRTTNRFFSAKKLFFHLSSPGTKGNLSITTFNSPPRIHDILTFLSLPLLQRLQMSHFQAHLGPHCIQLFTGDIKCTIKVTKATWHGIQIGCSSSTQAIQESIHSAQHSQCLTSYHSCFIFLRSSIYDLMFAKIRINQICNCIVVMWHVHIYMYTTHHTCTYMLHEQADIATHMWALAAEKCFH